METYRVDTKSYRFFHGLVKLTENQAKLRGHQLKPRGEGIFEIIQPIEFKAGEELGYDGEVNAALLQNITPISQIKAEEEEGELSKASGLTPKGKKPKEKKPEEK